MNQRHLDSILLTWNTQFPMRQVMYLIMTP